MSTNQKTYESTVIKKVFLILEEANKVLANSKSTLENKKYCFDLINQTFEIAQTVKKDEYKEIMYKEIDQTISELKATFTN